MKQPTEFIQISKWLDRTFTENLFEKHYRKNVRACVLKKTVISGDYSVYCVARLPMTGEEIMKDYMVVLAENERIRVEVLAPKD